ncbi:cupin domain-containing protein [Dokdonia genika]|uniref:Cupin domain-containing protein n=1 Tax=Dokdonia genika TaxID=308113 RepID=A0ABV9L6Z2_9FLAO
MKPINIHEIFTKFDKQWHPHQVATVDDMQVLLAKVSGEFVWHSHKDEDELFFVQKGVLEMRFRESGNSDKEWSETVHQGEIIVVPKGVEHCPTTKDGEEVHLLLFEKLSTAHTGEVIDAKTQTDYPKI